MAGILAMQYRSLLDKRIVVIFLKHLNFLNTFTNASIASHVPLN